MKRWSGLLVILLVAAVISGCTRKGEKVEVIPGAVNTKIYCIKNEETELVSENYAATQTDPRNMIWELIRRMEEGPSDINYKKAKPDDVEVERIELRQDGKLALYFNAAYNQVTGVNEVLMRAALVKTLCQVPEVESIEFYVDNQPLMLTGDKPVGFMRGDDFIDNTGDETNFYQYADVSLYFANQDATALIEVPVSIKYEGNIALAQLIVEQLIHGTGKINGAQKLGCKDCIPSGTKINKISVTEGICYLDLSQEFMDHIDGMDARLTIYSIVNSLVDLSNIDKVCFTIDGETKEYYQDSLSFSQDFERNLDIVEN